MLVSFVYWEGGVAFVEPLQVFLVIGVVGVEGDASIIRKSAHKMPPVK